MTTFRLPCLVFLLFVANATAHAAWAPELVYNAAPGTAAYDYTSGAQLEFAPVRYGAFALYPAINEDGSLELWRTNFQPGGFMRLALIQKYLFANLPLCASGVTYPKAPAAFGFIFLELNKVTNECRVWSTQGTPATTRIIKTFAAPDVKYGFTWTGSNGFTNFFVILNGIAELWRTDGTESNTTLVRTFGPPAGGTVVNVAAGVQGSTRALITIADRDSGKYAEWVTDGTAGNTHAVTGGLYFDHKSVIGDTFLLTTFTQLLALRPGTTQPVVLRSFQSDLVEMQQEQHSDGPLRFFYVRSNQQPYGTWYTDGTAAGTRAVQHNVPSNPLGYVGGRYILEDLNRNLSTLNAATGKLTAFKTMAPNIQHSLNLHRIGLWRPTVVEPYLYFEGPATEEWQPRTLWRTDGTADGTISLSTALPSPTYFDFGPRIVFNGQLYMGGLNDQTHGEWWRVGPQPQDLQLVRDISLNVERSGTPLHLTPTSNGLFFVSELNRLFVTQGTPETTTEIIPPYNVVNTSIGSLFNLGSRAVALTSLPGGMYSTDGTQAGTELVIAPEALDEVGGLETMEDRCLAHNGMLYFEARPAGQGYQIMRTQGTAATTIPLVASNGETRFVVFNGSVYILTGKLLYVTDGTTATLAADFTSLNFQTIFAPVAWNGRLWFTGTHSGNHELWSSDGTLAGTQLEVAIQGEVPFWEVATSGIIGRYGNGAGFCFTDGTPANTRFFNLLDFIDMLGEHIVAGDNVVFGGREGQTNWRLWTTDGTAEGTEILLEYPRELYSEAWMPVNFHLLDGTVYFGWHHTGDLWRTDGTPGGTERMCQFDVWGSRLLRNTADTGQTNTARFIDTRNMAIFNGDLYTNGYDHRYGHELFRIAIDSDDDGFSDAMEGSGDLDGDGIPNYLDDDANGNFILDVQEGDLDRDNDGIADYLDDDNDNDGLRDADEDEADTDNDGLPNAFDPDSDGDGLLDGFEGDDDFDGDGIPNYLDTDSDGDGSSDANEVNLGSDPLDASSSLPLPALGLALIMAGAGLVAVRRKQKD